MSTIVIQDHEGAGELTRSLADASAFALDCEAAGFHRYTDRLCLVQLTVDGRTFVLDPLALDLSDLLREPLADPDVRVLMHGADYDVRLLDRDLGLRIRGLFDTQVAASLLGEPVLGLSPLLDRHLGVTLAKKYQRADWAQRPLPQDMIEYAASDTHYLAQLVSILEEALVKADRVTWAVEEFTLLERIEWEENADEDPVVRVKGARKLLPRDVAALREALGWRDEIARAKDRAPFRVAGDEALVAVARERPRTMNGLQRIKGISRGMARSAGEDLLRRVRAVEDVPAGELKGYPPIERTGPGRPPPEIEELAMRLKEARNRRAEALGLARGTLMSNATLMEIARRGPRSEAALGEVPGVKQWQMQAVGTDLLEVLRTEGSAKTR